MELEKKISAAEPLQMMAYFCEWGGKSWKKLVNYAIHSFLGADNIRGKEVLDIGTRHGKMSILFAILGGRVTGIDINKDCLINAQKEAGKFNVQNITNFIHYNGELDIFPDDSFDIVFTKSVLVLVPDLENFLRSILRKLKPNGKVVFVENGYGNFLINTLRVFRHRKWDFHKAHFFKESDLRLFYEIFSIKEIKKTLFPPIYLICGSKLKHVSA